jgi:ABC-type nitrate/sulfonate/bicarbonate transport system permease component
MAVEDTPILNRSTGRRRLDFDSVAAVVLGAAGIATAICLMELATKTGVVHARDLPPAFDIIRTFFDQLRTHHFWQVVGQTMSQFAIGFGISVAISVPLGIAIGASELLWRALRPTIEFLRPVPPVAFLTLLILLYGTGALPAIILVVFGSMWSILIQVIYGMRDRDEVMLQTARSLRLGWWRRLFSVTLPSITPYLATGMRLGVAYALIGCISAEVLISTPGLGAEVWLDFQNGAITLAYAYTLAAGLIGVAVYLISTRAEARFLRWHYSQQRNRGGG